jgi:glutamate carboxypeptidase
MQRTPANVRLWHIARKAGTTLGLELEEATAGGASDGNTTSLYTPTLDGLGPVGGGAHADDEHVDVDRMGERAALLALLIMEPELGRPGRRHAGTQRLSQHVS